MNSGSAVRLSVAENRFGRRIVRGWRSLFSVDLRHGCRRAAGLSFAHRVTPPCRVTKHAVIAREPTRGICNARFDLEDPVLGLVCGGAGGHDPGCSVVGSGGRGEAQSPARGTPELSSGPREVESGAKAKGS